MIIGTIATIVAVLWVAFCVYSILDGFIRSTRDLWRKR